MSNINNYNNFDNKIKKENDLLLMNLNSSYDKKIIEETRNKLDNSLSDNNLKKIFQSNYSFSDKTIGNEFSKAHFESIEEELISKKKKNSNKKEKPIILSHSDYFYCPNSKTEKNLNNQIMKYLHENNLTIQKKVIKTNNVYNNYKNDNYEINNFKIDSLKDSKILIYNNGLDENVESSNNNNCNYGKPTALTEPVNNCLKQYLEQIKRNKIFNAQINQINNIKIKNVYITNDKNINAIQKSKPVNKSKCKKEKIINSKENKNKNIINDNLRTHNSNTKNKIMFSKDKNKNKSNKNNVTCKNKKVKNNSTNKIIGKNKNIYDFKINRENEIIKKSQKNEIKSPLVNKKIINNNKNKKINKLTNLSSVSLQSINDSKLLILANDLIEKDKELSKF